MKFKLGLSILILIFSVILTIPLVHAQTPINCGQTLSGSITTAGQRNSYTFSASTNDGITIRARKISGNLTPYIELYSPGGALITGAANQIDRILTETGTYRIDIRDQNNTNTGDYLLFWQRMNNPCNATPISCGQVVTGSIGTSVDPPPWRVYTFTGAVNDVLTIRTGNLTGGNFVPNIELYSPIGSLLASNYNQLDRTLTVAGTYTILIRSYSAGYAGNFTLTWQRMNAPCNLTPINCGQVLSGSISAGKLDVYSFTVSANDVVTIRRMTTSGMLNAYVELFNAAGSRIAGPSTQIDMTLTTAGTYTIMVKDYYTNATGNYLIYWQTLKNPCNVVANLSCGQVVSGSIGTSVDTPPWRIYTFSGAVNDVVTIRAGNLTSGNFLPNIELYSPTGSLLVSNYNQVDRTLTASGTYTILMRCYSPGYVGNFTLTWQKMNAPCNLTPINCGQVLSGSISITGELDVYTFSASANDVVTIRVRATSGTLYPNIELFNAAGSRIAGPSAQVDMTLSAAGTYTILVRHFTTTTATGNYLVYWQTVKNPCNVVANLACGQVVPVSIGTSADPPPWRVYTFTGAVNDVLTIRTGNLTPSSFTPNIELYSPTGSLLVSNYNQVDRTLTAAGTYTILMRALSAGTSGNFALTWQRMNNPCNLTPISCGQVLSGSISTAGKLVVYAVTVSANEVVTIRARKTSGTLNPYLELFNAAGSRIAGPSTQIDMTLAAAGTYTIVVRDYNTTATGDYLVTWQRFNTPCAPAIPCGQAATGGVGTTTGAPPWAFYTLTLSANDVVKIRAVKTSGSLVPYLELYSFSGGLVTSAAAEINTTLTSAGIYTVVVRDQNNTYTGGYAVTWQKWNNPSALTINCGQVVSGSIGTTANPPPWKYYSLTASANDSVTIRVTKISGTFTAYLELYGPTGTLVGSGTGQLDRTLTPAGTYTIVVRDQNSINTGDFVLIWHRMNNPCNATTIGCGQVLQGALSAVGKINVYTFSATAGDNVVLTLTKTSGGLDPTLELYNSSGSKLAYQYTPSGNQVIITQTLSTGGTYTVFASDYGNDETGNHSLKFQKNNNSCPEVTISSPNGGERIVTRSDFTIRWSCANSQGISSQEIRLSADGGVSFPNVITTGLQGSVRSYDWTVPPEMVTNQARIRLTVTDGLGMNTSDDSDANFEIYQGVGRTYIYDELNRLIQVIYEDGRKVTYTYDAAGNRITLETQNPDTVPPTGTSIINSGAAVANNPVVTLTLSCSDNVGCSQMQFSNNNVTYSTPEAFGTTKSWTLSAGDGTKTVYAKFKDQVGNWSTAYSDTIDLKTYDLTMTSVSGPTTANITQQITVTSTVKNQGGSTSGAFRVGIYLSTDATMTTSDIFLGYASVSSLAGGGQKTNSTTVRIPASAPAGTYYIGAIGDYANAISETNEANNGLAGNQITVTTLSPDLIMTGVSGPGTANITQQITVTSIVKNQGGTTSGFSVGIYLSTDATITTSDSRIGSTSVSFLGANGQLTFNTSARIPANKAAGTYYVGAIADYGNAVSEANETNNALTGNQITITAISPDLIISSVSGPSNGVKGTKIAVTCTVKNQGGDTGGFNVGIYLSTDTTITTADTRIGYWSVGSLLAGGDKQLTGSFTIPSTLATGVYYIGAIADYGNAVAESNETNNTLTGNQITVSP